MRIVIHQTAENACGAVAKFIADALRAKPDAVLGLPTGQTPVLLYRALAALHAEGRADFSQATTFNLDEFLGVTAGDPRSFHAFMQRHFFGKVNLPSERANVLDGAARSPKQEAEQFERRIADAGGLDIVILGIGRNGHIGFNEPASSLHARTHLARLTIQTRRANANLAGGRWQRVPARALSMGIATIMNGRTIILLATGATKAGIIRRALTGPITTRVPASLLRAHPNLIVVLDRAASKRV